MGEIAITPEVRFRDNLGRFTALCEAAAFRTMQDAEQEGVRLAKEFAPKSFEYDPRTVKLAASITGSSTHGKASWGSSARHALAQEFGSRAHFQTGNVTFWWEAEARLWHPGDNLIHHPGNPAHPYLRPSYEIVMHRIMTFARKNYPN